MRVPPALGQVLVDKLQGRPVKQDPAGHAVKCEHTSAAGLIMRPVESAIGKPSRQERAHAAMANHGDHTLARIRPEEGLCGGEDTCAGIDGPLPSFGRSIWKSE